MSVVDQHAEVHRLKAEHGYGARRIAAGLGITRYAAERLLARPLPQPVAEKVAEVADHRPPVAEPVAEPVRQERPVADHDARPVGQDRPVAGLVAGVAEPVVAGVAEPVGHVAGVVRFPRPGARGGWLKVDLSRRPWLLRDLVRLARVGLRIPYVVDLAVRSFAAAYWEAVTGGHLAPGQPYEIHTRVRPRRAA